MADGVDLSQVLQEALSGGPGVGNLERAVALVAFLREHCPWDRKQTPESLLPHLLEESHEVADAVRQGNPDAVEDELGDLLLNLAFQLAIAEERGTFSGTSVWEGLKAKMIRRHPHLFGGDARSWDESKRSEASQVMDAPGLPDASEPQEPGTGIGTGIGTPEPHAARRTASPRPSVLDHLSVSASPLRLACQIQKRVSRLGFDWDEPVGGLEKVREETDEVASLLHQDAAEAHAEIAEEVGDLLFSVVNLARLLKLDPSEALAGANQKFVRRFQALEALAATEGLPMPGTDLEALDQLWDRAKELTNPKAALGEG